MTVAMTMAMTKSDGEFPPPPNDGMTVVLKTGSVVSGLSVPFSVVPVLYPPFTNANDTNDTNDKMTVPK